MALLLNVLFVFCSFLLRWIHSQEVGGSNALQTVYRPFEFGFQSDDGSGTTQHRKESGNENGFVKGSYGFTDPSGMYRAVDYFADTNGFRAVVKTNEPGTANQNPADTVWLVQPQTDTFSTATDTRTILKRSSLLARSSPSEPIPDARPSNLLLNHISSANSSPLTNQYPVLGRPGSIITVPSFYKRAPLLKYLSQVKSSPYRQNIVLK